MKPGILPIMATAITAGTTQSLIMASAAAIPMALAAAPVVVIAGGAVIAGSAILDIRRQHGEEARALEKAAQREDRQTIELLRNRVNTLTHQVDELLGGTALSTTAPLAVPAYAAYARYR